MDSADLETQAERIANPGDRVELRGEQNRFGGRIVAASIEHDAGEFVVRVAGQDEQRVSDLADAIAEVDPIDAEREDWTFST